MILALLKGIIADFLLHGWGGLHELHGFIWAHDSFGTRMTANCTNLTDGGLITRICLDTDMSRLHGLLEFAFEK